MVHLYVFCIFSLTHSLSFSFFWFNNFSLSVLFFQISFGRSGSLFCMHTTRNELKRQNIRKQIMEIYLNEWNYHHEKPLIWLMGDELMANMHVTCNASVYSRICVAETCFCRHFFPSPRRLLSCVYKKDYLRTTNQITARWASWATPSEWFKFECWSRNKSFE